MSKVDDELTRRLHQAERPVDADDLFEGLQRRRTHRERLRHVQIAVLSVTVLAATVGGFAALSTAFGDRSVQPATPQPTETPGSAVDGEDIGLGFPVCNAERLDGIDWYGDGTLGAAWTAARATDGGSCPASGEGGYIVAADLDGDGSAEPGGMGFLDHCLLCRPFASADLNADGVLELVVLAEASSTPSYTFFEVSVPTSERSPGIYNLIVAPPGHEPAGLRAGEPLRIDAGGDEGYSSQIECGDGADGRELVWGWSNQPVDSAELKEVHVARIQLQPDGLFHVIGFEDYTVAAGEPSGLAAGTDPSCGVDWHPAA